MHNPVPDISEDQSSDSAKLQNSILIIGGGIGTGVVQSIGDPLSVQCCEGSGRGGVSVGTQGRG